MCTVVFIHNRVTAVMMDGTSRMMFASSVVGFDVACVCLQQQIVQFGPMTG